MNWFGKAAWLFLGVRAKRRLFHEIKRKGIVAYLHVLRAARNVVTATFAIFLLLQLMMLSAVGALVTGVLRWTPDPKTQLEILFYVFTAMFVVPALVVIIALSEKVWYRLSGAKKLVDEVQRSDS